MTSVTRVIHRADYHRVLVNEAKRLGVKIRLGSNVETVKFEQSTILLSGGEVVAGDVIVGADGMLQFTYIAYSLS